MASKDAFDVETELCRVAGALRALSGLLHSARDDLDLCKPADLGYLVGCLAGDAERAQEGASALMFSAPSVDGAIEKLRAIKTA